MRLSVPHLVFAALLAALSSSADARTIQVFPDPGNAPIAAALAELESGDKLVLNAGTYDERITLVDLTRVKVFAKGEVILDAAGPSASILVTNCDRIRIQGLTVRDAPSQAMLVVNSSRVVIKRCTLEDFTTQGIQIGNSEKVSVLKCALSGGVYGIYVTTASTAKIVGNTVTGTSQPSIFLVVLSLPGTKIIKNVISGSGSSGIELSGVGNKAVKNTISDCLFGITTPFAGGDMAGSSIARNTVTDTVVALRTYSSGGLVLTKNSVQNATASAMQIASIAEDVVARSNKIDGANSGIDDEGTRSIVSGNWVANTNIYGIRARGTTGTFDRNKVNDTAGDGFDVWTAGNTFVRNRATGNAGLDLDSSGLAETENTYVKNTFGTTAFD